MRNTLDTLLRPGAHLAGATSQRDAWDRRDATTSRMGPSRDIRVADLDCRRNPSGSDIHARNRTPFANVSLWTDDATEGRPPGPGVIP